MIGIDLFAGAGGMSWGARASGVDVQSVVEIDPYAAKTYERNHMPKYGVYKGDIRNYDSRKLDLPKKEKVIVFGGPPCQGFSTSNQKTRTVDNRNNWLFQEFVRVVSEIHPDCFVFENVRGILETANGIFVDKISEMFDELGYQTTYQLLHATDFGIPQKRARFFMVGTRKSDGVKFSFPEKSCTKEISVEDAIHDLPGLKNGDSVSYREYIGPAKSEYATRMRDDAEGCSNHLVTRNSKTVLERYKYIPQGGNWESIPDRLMKNYTDKSRCHTGIYRRLELHSPSVVIGNYRKNMLIHPTQNRGLSVREAARLQSFPDKFVFEGSIGFQQQQVGNAVPPLLAKALFDSINQQMN